LSRHRRQPRRGHGPPSRQRLRHLPDAPVHRRRARRADRRRPHGRRLGTPHPLRHRRPQHRAGNRGARPLRLRLPLEFLSLAAHRAAGQHRPVPDRHQPLAAAELQPRGDEHGAGDGRGDACRAAAVAALRLPAALLRRLHRLDRGEGMSAILAIDLGGTRLRAGIADIADPAAVEAVGEWPAPEDLEGFREHVRELLGSHGCSRLGLAIPGLASGTTCRWVPNLGYLDGADLAQHFPGLEIALGNDAQLALLAEAEAGAARDMQDAILLAIGTGIGSAVLAGGRIVRGSNGGACSFGWAAADLADEGDARSGWLERHASGRALDAAARSIGLSSGTGLITAARHGAPAAQSALVAPMTAL